jgi:hypothetical protein
MPPPTGYPGPTGGHSPPGGGYAPSGATITNISGQWKSSIGLVYEISQTGTSFTWTVAATEEQGHGSLRGTDIDGQWTGPRGSGSAKGRVIADAQSRGLRIEWSNGVMFTR